MQVISVANVKGGSGKTTTAAFVAHALHEQGRRVVVVDADPQESAVRWSSYAGGWSMPVVAMTSNALHRKLPGVVGDRYDVAVIDTPPIEDQRGVVTSALVIATHVIVPMAPAPAEIERIGGVRRVLTSAADLRVTGQPPVSAVLLSRTVAGAASTAAWRDHLETAGWWVLRVHVPRLERFSQAFGSPIERASATGYGDAVIELLEGTRV